MTELNSPSIWNGLVNKVKQLLYKADACKRGAGAGADHLDDKMAPVLPASSDLEQPQEEASDLTPMDSWDEFGIPTLTMDDPWVAAILPEIRTPELLLEHPHPDRAIDIASADRDWSLDQRLKIWISPIRNGREVTGWNSLAVLYEQDLEGAIAPTHPCIIRQSGEVEPTGSVAAALREAIVAVLDGCNDNIPIDLVTPCQPITAFGNKLIQTELRKGGDWAVFEEYVDGRPMDFITLGTSSPGWPAAATMP